MLRRRRTDNLTVWGVEVFGARLRCGGKTGGNQTLPSARVFNAHDSGRGDDSVHTPPCERIMRSHHPPGWCEIDRREPTMSKRARKRRSRKGNAANHGRKPNA